MIHSADNNGDLLYFEGNRDFDFDIKRIYFICNAMKGTKRGGHAHKKLKQLLFCPYGIIKLIFDDGISKIEVILDNPTIGIIVSPCTWRDMIWLETDSVLCVAASEYYLEDDYIRNYDAFLNYISEMKWKEKEKNESI